MSNYTSGPWHTAKREVRDQYGNKIAEAATARHICEGTPEGNAKLMAAAPDLLKALYTAEALLLNMGMQSSDAYQEINAAIAKAEA